MSRETVLKEVAAERDRQDLLWGGAPHDDAHQLADWLVIVTRHLGLAAYDGAPADACHKTEPRARYDPARFRKQMVRVAAVAVAALESLDRRLLVERWQRFADDAGVVLLVLPHDNPARYAEGPGMPYAVAEQDADAWERHNYLLRVEPGVRS